MPTYDYKCAKCQRSLAVEQSIREAPLKKCRHCGGKLERQLPKSVNLIFKGSGFYVTDYKSGAAGRTGSRKPGPAKPKEGETEGKD
jgi:putative FmdB family regulatory protein